MHLNTVYGKVKGEFFSVKKRTVTFSYNRWHCTQANLGKYANQSPITCREKNWVFILYFSVIDICLDMMLILVDKALLVKFYYLSQESGAEALQRFQTESGPITPAGLISTYTMFWRSKKFAGSALQVVRHDCQRFVPPPVWLCKWTL